MNNYDSSTDRKIVNNAFGLNKFLTKMYGWMALSVLVSGLVAYITGSVYHVTLSGIQTILAFIVWFVLSMTIQSTSLKNPLVGFIQLMIFASLTGVMFSGIVLTYTGATIFSAFVTAAADFIIMAFIGVVTKKNLDKLGTQAYSALIAVVIVSIVNIFLKVSLFEIVLSIVLVGIFTVLTAYDAQKMKNLYNQYNGQVSDSGLAINGALILYLDFVNLFLQLLQLFGLGDNRD
ncbi:Bax inhibitor-1/YccA family protein [Apilactobacillus xinyiensis]|uniref:Bax inhibitor-1/YccA family protein n=1 Tax=Apilactobacillus xinyiensis TaxID=2841032 RepID=UPI001C7D975D|nr:Bax inhibitor-1/YccA family protein [Apilactobacillus xinyiensis]MCL0318453.1 Bax inhibitor-1/YccA family protein [Apilactobacillus xinyiensis]